MKKVLVIISSHEMDINNSNHIQILHDYLINNKNISVDYCGISNQNDFHNYENIITFKYKMINPKFQLSKICDFITETNLDYDWYIKIRPDIKLLEPINFDVLSDNAINARARVYKGPKKIKYGMSVNGPGYWAHIGDCYYNDIEQEDEIVIDDMFYIFHNNLIKNGGFNKINSDVIQNEWFHTRIWKERNINLNIIGICLNNMKYCAISGNLNC